MALQTSFMTTAQFSAASGTPVKIITRWLREGKLKGEKKSGKWAISADQVNGLPADSAPAATTATEKPAVGDKTYSVAEFSEMTYLTPFGVTQWLTKGILSGHREANGSWQVDAANLESERVKRLLRG